MLKNIVKAFELKKNTKDLVAKVLHSVAFYMIYFFSEAKFLISTQDKPLIIKKTMSNPVNKWVELDEGAQGVSSSVGSDRATSIMAICPQCNICRLKDPITRTVALTGEPYRWIAGRAPCVRFTITTRPHHVRPLHSRHNAACETARRDPGRGPPRSPHSLPPTRTRSPRS